MVFFKSQKEVLVGADNRNYATAWVVACLCSRFGCSAIYLHVVLVAHGIYPGPISILS